MARPKDFDREEVLEKAMKVFWAKGYEGASVPELLEAMDLSRSSLYTTFVDKENLFKEAVVLYMRNVADHRHSILNNAQSVKQGLREFFQDQIETATNENLPGGCLVTNTTVYLKIIGDKTRKIIVDDLQKIEDGFYDLLQKGVKSGEIAADKDTRGLARLLMGVTYGLNLAARIHPDKRVLQDMVDSALLAI